MRKNKYNFLIIPTLILGIALACNLKADEPENPSAKNEPKIEKLESYTIKGLNFAYYKIPADLSREKLIETAREIHEKEADTQLILVDDDSGVADYVKYVKAISAGEDAALPKEWADKHIVANVQKYMNGRWVLCEKYGYKEIADL